MDTDAQADCIIPDVCLRLQSAQLMADLAVAHRTLRDVAAVQVPIVDTPLFIIVHANTVVQLLFQRT